MKVDTYRVRKLKNNHVSDRTEEITSRAKGIVSYIQLMYNSIEKYLLTIITQFDNDGGYLIQSANDTQLTCLFFL